MTLFELEVEMKHLWAKSSGNPDVPGTTLFQHSMDVVKQMVEYYDLYRPEWPVANAPICLPRVLAYAALVHDFGKVHVHFQDVLHSRRPKFGNRHEILSLCFLDWLDIPAEECPWIDAVVALHHKNLFALTAAGRPFYVSDNFGAVGTDVRRLSDGVKSGDAVLLYEALCHAEEIFQNAGWNGFTCYPLRAYHSIHCVNSICCSLERVRKLAKCFETQMDDYGNIQSIPWAFRRGGIQTRGLILLADHLASAKPHSLCVGLEYLSEVKAAIKVKTKITKFDSHQSLAADQQGNAILVAPTGSGKTEAALMWSAKQAETGRRGRTFVLLPYQASMNAMQRRLVETFFSHLEKLPDRWNDKVALIHGRSVRTAYERVLDQEDYNPEKAAKVARIQSDLARLDVAPIRICSPYQVLRLLFEPRGVEGLLQSLSQGRFIFDEIHAYSPEVTALTLAAAQFLTEHLDASVLFMTATLPSHLMEVLESVFGNMPILRPGQDIFERPPRHQVQILRFAVLSQDSIKKITEAAKDGSVLVVVNQVGRAIKLCQTLKSCLQDVRLLHSRFTNQDRFEIEKHLRPGPGSVLIATQAVEVSLDVSYTTCFSELAPLESLLQRFGRCNRRSEQTGPAKVYVYSQFPAAAAKECLPYKEAHLCSTLQVIEKCVSERKGVLAEDQIESMLNASYPEDLKNELKEEIGKKSKLIRENFSRDFMPFGAQDQSHFEELARQWEDLFDGHEVLPESFRESAEQEQSWLGRARYYVPLSGTKFRWLYAQGKIDWCGELMCHIVKAPYSELGLQV
jgi:CRISPR-associated endonuclease/helicase Cas3